MRETETKRWSGWRRKDDRLKKEGVRMNMYVCAREERLTERERERVGRERREGGEEDKR